MKRVLQHAGALVRTQREVEVGHGLRAELLHGGEDADHGEGVVKTLPLAVLDEAVVERVEDRFGQRVAEPGQGDAVEIAVALAPPHVYHDEDAYSGRVGSQAERVFGELE